jgi:serine/threonine-protein kinase
MTGVWRRLVSFAAPLRDASAEDRTVVETARRAFNQRRVRVFATGMTVVHALSFSYFMWFAAAAGPAQLTWRDNLRSFHAIWCVAALSLVIAARRPRPFPFIGEAFTFTYALYGAVLSTNTQLIGRTVDVFMAALIALAFATRVHAAWFTAASGLSLAILLAGIAIVQPDAAARASGFANAIPVALVSWVASRVSLGAFARETLQARVIERQRDELEHLAGALDRQLREKRVDRSRELARAVEAAFVASSRGELEAGATLADRFVIDRPIGRGGMGTVYRASDRVLGRTVAVKILSFAPDATALRRFLREVEVMADIAHPGIVRALSVDVASDGRLFQVHELVDGESLDQLLRRDASMAPAHVAAVGAAIAEALATAHARGVVHRDVKPANVMLTRNAPGVKLLDFGISKLLSAGAAEVTREGRIVGTPAFMAPEQRSADSETREAADVYALGATLRALLAHARDPAGARLDELVTACLANVPDDRPTAARARDDLVAIAGDVDLLGANATILEPSAQITAPTADARKVGS